MFCNPPINPIINQQGNKNWLDNTAFAPKSFLLLHILIYFNAIRHKTI